MTRTDRVALVTGGASGIGRACVERFLADGMRVLFTDLAAEDGRRTLEQLREAGATVEFLEGDVSDPQHASDAASRALRLFGRIDVLVANAGLQRGGRLVDTRYEEWQQVLEVNLLGVAWSCRAVIPAMIDGGGGAIVAISSVNALRGFPGMAAYDAAKAGVLALVRHVAVEHGRSGIRANAVCPGATITDFHLRRAAARGMDAQALRASMSDYALLGRAAEPREIAGVVAFLAGPDASFVTGQALVADGGLSAAGSR